MVNLTRDMKDLIRSKLKTIYDKKVLDQKRSVILKPFKNDINKICRLKKELTKCIKELKINVEAENIGKYIYVRESSIFKDVVSCDVEVKYSINEEYFKIIEEIEVQKGDNKILAEIFDRLNKEIGVEK